MSSICEYCRRNNGGQCLDIQDVELVEGDAREYDKKYGNGPRSVIFVSAEMKRALRGVVSNAGCPQAQEVLDRIEKIDRIF